LLRNRDFNTAPSSAFSNLAAFIIQADDALLSSLQLQQSGASIFSFSTASIDVSHSFGTPQGFSADTINKEYIMDDRETSARHRVVTVVQRLLSARSITRAVCSEDVLSEAGLTSLDAVRLVLLVEDEFKVTIPMKEITPANFRSISAIGRLITKLQNHG
jgi:acyl carrier protein